MRRLGCSIVGLVWMLGAASVSAEECSVPVSPATLASALEVGPTASIPGALSGVPFSVFSLESMNLTWPTCGLDCVFTPPTGETECGDLVSNPTRSLYLVTYPDPIQPDLLSNLSARQSENGRWTLAAQAYVAANGVPNGGSAGYVFALGTREIVDLGSTSGTARLPLEIGLRASAPLGGVVCDGNALHWNATRVLRFRVHEQVPGNARRTLVSTVIHENDFGVIDDVFSVEVTPGAALTADVFLRVSGNATPGIDPFGVSCDGADVLFDMNPGLHFLGQSGGHPAYDGIQLQFTPDPALVFTPRSGIEYEAVPEPDAFAGGALASLLLGAWKRRRDRAAPRRGPSR